MQKMVYYCDKCKKEIEAPWLVVAEGLKNSADDTSELTDGMDLCGDCAGDWAKMKAAWLADKPRGKTGRKLLDREKIMSLHAAGWSLEKIADEMNCMPDTIRTIISKAKKAASDE